MDEEKGKCKNCDIEFEWAGLSDIDSGDVLISADIEYCPECLCINYSNVKLSK